MRNLKKAFGRPDSEFHFRVQQTLSAIEQSDQPVQRRRFSPALALCAGLCMMFIMVGCFVAGARYGMNAKGGFTPLAAGVSATAEPLDATAEVVDATPTSSPMATAEPTAAPTAALALADNSPEPEPADEPPENEMALASAMDEAATADVTSESDAGSAYTTVYATMNIGGLIHFDPGCDECPAGAVAMPMADAVMLEKDICPLCSQTAEIAAGDVYANIYENAYHFDPQCKALEGETVIGLTYPEALQFNMVACAMCVGDDPLCAVEPGSMVYHSQDVDLQYGMIIPLQQALNQGFTPCPDCQPDGVQPLARQVIDAQGMNAMYYGTKGGVYYHMNPNCSGMMNAVLSTEMTWLSTGKEACPVCIDNTRTDAEISQ